MSAYHRFRRKARTLGAISSSFDAIALSATAAYHMALTQPAPETWTTLLTQTASLVGRTHEFDRILVLDAAEREALDFFEAIVRENADLLVGSEGKTAAVRPDSLSCVVSLV